MKANELRIGNWVIHNHSVGMKLKAKLDCVDDLKLVKEFEPIPLTEEWLLKFGFRKDGNYWRIGTNWFYVQMECAGVKGFCFRPIDGYCKRLDSVHDLQNLYFALTGEELTIK